MMLEASSLWLHVEEGWHARLFPEGCLVRRKSDNYVGLVQRTYPYLFVTWTCKPLAGNVWQEDLTDTSLVHHICVDVKEWEALPTKIASPLQLFLEDMASGISEILKIACAVAQ